MEYLARLHPVVIHFPIALFLAAAVADQLSARLGRRQYDLTASFCVTLATVSAYAAGIFGWFAADTASVPHDPAWMLIVHQWLGLSTIGFGTIAVLTNRLYHRRGKPIHRALYRLALYSAAMTVAGAGHLGSLLVRGEDFFKWGGAQ
ncbi:MAG TPA: hypothetical protein PKE12_04600 [Kiritimatiellia bacterium]|nr:hypothetical protein [Kiritimatiellia bacterium]